MTGSPWLAVFAFDQEDAARLVKELSTSALAQSQVVLITDNPGVANAANTAAGEQQPSVTAVWGDQAKVSRIAKEYFGWSKAESAENQAGHSPWFLVDRWGEVRMSFPSPTNHAGVISKLQELQSETEPPAPEFGFYQAQAEGKTDDQ